jgi:hypothetical protein
VYICYLDESGNVERKGTTPYFVLLGLSIFAESWKAKDREVQAALKSPQPLRRSSHRLDDAPLARAPAYSEFRGDGAGRPPRCGAPRAEADLAKASMRGRRAVKALSKNYQETEPFIHHAGGMMANFQVQHYVARESAVRVASS